MNYLDFIKNDLGNEIADKLFKNIELKPVSSLKINTIIGCPSLVYESLLKHPYVPNGYYFDKNTNPLGKSIYHAAGCFYIQEPSAMIVGELLDVKETDIVLDLCSAPGGKLTSIAPKLKKGIVVANEISSKRCLDLRENVERMGYSNVYITNENVDNLLNNFEGFFDCVILDAPCSGEGMFRKNIESYNDWDIDKVNRQVSIQKDLILKAYKMLNYNGKLIYSTCTFNTFENEQIIKYLLENTNASLINLPHNKDFDKGVNLEEAIRLFPFNFNGEGHFICLIKCNDSHVGKLNRFKYKIDSKSLAIYRRFEKENINIKLDENRLFKDGNNLYFLPEIPIDFHSLNVVKYGLYLGEINKEIFVPSHHLSHALYKNYLHLLELEESKIKDYLSGQSFKVNASNGYYIVTYNSYPLGMCKISNQILKNYYPKNLRRLSF